MLVCNVCMLYFCNMKEKWSSPDNLWRVDVSLVISIAITYEQALRRFLWAAQQTISKIVMSILQTEWFSLKFRPVNWKVSGLHLKAER